MGFLLLKKSHMKKEI
uniref:Uncharacterized protein n=1 Tax=Rhizophora mucronata TaxID=61149 RepID=A0A2P2QF34_RHIMU